MHAAAAALARVRDNVHGERGQQVVPDDVAQLVVGGEDGGDGAPIGEEEEGEGE